MLVLSLTVLFAALAPISLSKPQTSGKPDAAQTVKAFYRYHFAHNKCYDEGCLRRRRGWLSAELYNLLNYELHRKLPPDTVPYIEGDPFTCSQETPDSFRIGKSEPHGSGANVEVFVYWHEQKKVLEQRKYSFAMVWENGRWKIGDIIDNQGGSLVNELKELKRKDSQGTSGN